VGGEALGEGGHGRRARPANVELGGGHGRAAWVEQVELVGEVGGGHGRGRQGGQHHQR